MVPYDSIACVCTCRVRCPRSQHQKFLCPFGDLSVVLRKVLGALSQTHAEGEASVIYPENI